MASLLHARRITPLLGFLLVAVVFAIDTLTTIGGAIAVLYVLALLLVAPSLGIRRLIAVALLCVVLTLTSFLIAHSDDWPGDAIMRCAIALLAIMAATLLLIRGKKDSQSLAKQAALLDLSHEAIFVRGRDNLVTYWSDGAADLYGWPADEAVGRDADELLATEFATPRSSLVEQVSATGRWEGELMRRRRDGAKVVVLARWSISRAEGEAAALLETNTDITELRLAHDSLRRREAELRTAQRLSQTGSVSCDIAGGDFSWSAETARIFGYPADAPPTRAMFEARLHPDDRAETIARIAASHESPEVFDLLFRLTMPDQSVRHLHMVTEQSVSRSGRVMRTGAVRDETAERDAELALHRAQQELARVSRLATLGELTASIAHEVNQPLAGVVANGEAALRWMRREPPNLVEVDQAVNRMIADGRRASEVVTHIRRLTGRGATVEHHDFDMNDTIEATVHLLRSELTIHGVRIETDLAADLPPLHGNRVQIQQVLINLIVNAIQSIEDADGWIRIASRSDGRSAIVEVADSGKGISPEVSGRLFEAFVTTKPTGMGMGLSICRTIVEAHGGTISPVQIESRGALFRIMLPLDHDERSNG
ncbi:ATP-binding protein [Kaistia geumhonensis]|uniref:histidine kinase n=1 Tax=Kaistia geumhonensis TaxID=410839 RepID=A0ABU0M8P5_9HYPH|nr:ATP-binding protein [Kaistia geumhonensis]MCX5477453.1 ATP-binding protein [Kaistia geumhonensis]MDQ0517340.1 PAS domain S-box-containing protein [Kaistia geumhonensis]